MADQKDTQPDTVAQQGSSDQQSQNIGTAQQSQAGSANQQSQAGGANQQSQTGEAIRQTQAGAASQQPQQGAERRGGSGQPQQEMALDQDFRSQIREHMEVIDNAGAHVGTVDSVSNDRIKLTRSDSSTDMHRYVPIDLVAGIQDETVQLRERGDNAFGIEA